MRKDRRRDTLQKCVPPISTYKENQAMYSLFLAGIQLLHIPDGFLNIPISGLCWVVTLIVLYFAVKQAQKGLEVKNWL